MRLQVILHQGPFDGHFMSLSKSGDDWPLKIRIAHAKDETGPVEAFEYRRHDVDDEHGIFMGSYIFTHSFESARSLIEFWI